MKKKSPNNLISETHARSHVSRSPVRRGARCEDGGCARLNITVRDQRIKSPRSSRHRLTKRDRSKEARAKVDQESQRDEMENHITREIMNMLGDFSDIMSTTMIPRLRELLFVDKTLKQESLMGGRRKNKIKTEEKQRILKTLNKAERKILLDEIYKKDKSPPISVKLEKRRQIDLEHDNYMSLVDSEESLPQHLGQRVAAVPEFVKLPDEEKQRLLGKSTIEECKRLAGAFDDKQKSTLLLNMFKEKRRKSHEDNYSRQEVKGPRLPNEIDFLNIATEEKLNVLYTLTEREKEKLMDKYDEDEIKKLLVNMSSEERQKFLESLSNKDRENYLDILALRLPNTTDFLNLSNRSKQNLLDNLCEGEKNKLLDKLDRIEKTMLLLGMSEQERQKFLESVPHQDRPKYLDVLVKRSPVTEEFMKLPADEKQNLLDKLTAREKKKLMDNLDKKEKSKLIFGMSEEYRQKFLSTLPRKDRDICLDLLAARRPGPSEFKKLSVVQKQQLLTRLNKKEKKDLWYKLNEKERQMLLKRISEEERQKLIVSLPIRERHKYQDFNKASIAPEAAQFMRVSVEEKQKVSEAITKDENDNLFHKLDDKEKTMFLLRMPEKERQNFLLSLSNKKRKKYVDLLLARTSASGDFLKLSNEEKQKLINALTIDDKAVTMYDKEKQKFSESLPNKIIEKNITLYESNRKTKKTSKKKTVGKTLLPSSDAPITAPAREEALLLLWQALLTQASKTFFQQSITKITYQDAASWIIMENQVEIKEEVKNAIETEMLAEEFEKTLHDATETSVPEYLSGPMADVIVECGRIIAENFFSIHNKAVAHDILISAMQARGDDILIQVNASAETFYFAAQRLKRARPEKAVKPNTEIAESLLKNIKEVLECHNIPSRLSDAIQEESKLAAEYLSKRVTVPDIKIETHMILLKKMENAGDELLVEGVISRSFRDCAKYLNQLTSTENPYKEYKDCELYCALMQRLCQLIAPNFDPPQEMEVAIAENAELLVSYLKYLEKKSEELKTLFFKMRLMGNKILLRHGIVAKTYNDGAVLLERSNFEQLEDEVADQLVVEKLQFKLGTLVAADDVSKEVIDDVAIYLAVHFLARSNKPEPSVNKCNKKEELTSKHYSTCNENKTNCNGNNLTYNLESKNVITIVNSTVLPQTRSFPHVYDQKKTNSYHQTHSQSYTSQHSVKSTSYCIGKKMDSQINKTVNKRRPAQAQFPQDTSAWYSIVEHDNLTENRQALEKLNNSSTGTDKDGMLGWYAIMISLMWNMEVWRDWIQDNIDSVMRYNKNDSAQVDWRTFNDKIVREATRWRQYSTFTTKITNRLVQIDTDDTSPSTSSTKTRKPNIYHKCQQEMLLNIEIFDKWTLWFLRVAYDINSFREASEMGSRQLNHIRRKLFKSKLEKFLPNWNKYITFLQASWESKFQPMISGFLSSVQRSGPLWIASAYGVVPRGAVCAGEHNGQTMWVARVLHGNHLLPAAVVPSANSCVFYADCSTHYSNKYQVMCEADTQWIPRHEIKSTSRAAAVTPGFCVGRVSYRGSHYIGAVCAPSFRCRVVIGGHPFALRAYELLIFNGDSKEPYRATDSKL